jgi:hypothetical protein
VVKAVSSRSRYGSNGAVICAVIVRLDDLLFLADFFFIALHTELLKLNPIALFIHCFQGLTLRER